MPSTFFATLPPDSRARLLGKAQSVALTPGMVLEEPDGPTRHIFFPQKGSLVSLLAITPEGQTADVGLVGPEGFTGFLAVLGAPNTVHRAVSHCNGSAHRMAAEDFLAECRQSPVLHMKSLSFVSALTMQISQVALCNSVHTVPQRLARWLLMAHDRVDGSPLTLTQEMLATLLATRRSTVSISATELEKTGAIRCTRGVTHILDAERLKSLACSCYEPMHREFRRSSGQWS